MEEKYWSQGKCCYREKTSMWKTFDHTINVSWINNADYTTSVKATTASGINEWEYEGTGYNSKNLTECQSSTTHYNVTDTSTVLR